MAVAVVAILLKIRLLFKNNPELNNIVSHAGDIKPPVTEVISSVSVSSYYFVPRWRKAQPGGLHLSLLSTSALLSPSEALSETKKDRSTEINSSRCFQLLQLQLCSVSGHRL
ncbi:hypothetical protein GOODEAATRI_033093 [Goodea atripinnis]|uniref:Uncharacterized protein n=1 Tax=Goodea atripinnis TaxID=208336 RepID=A0ABV0NFQ8_9TELE